MIGGGIICRANVGMERMRNKKAAEQKSGEIAVSSHVRQLTMLLY